MNDIFWPWAKDFVIASMKEDKTIPNFLIDLLEPSLIPLADYLLDLNYYITARYTPERWNEEMLGLSDATGMSIW